METRDVLGIIAAFLFVGLSVRLLVPSPQPEVSLAIAGSFTKALWEYRLLDVFLQLLIILAGTFGILTLIKERR